MASSEQSRPPGQPATQATPVVKESPSPSGAALSIRLWRAPENAPAVDLSWTGDDPAVFLALDLIAAEQGVASAPRGRFLVAAFPGIQPAVLTARRLQWALQGLSEADRFAATAAAVLVHSAPDLPALENDSSVLLPLENAAPGQILLTAKAAELLHDLPGLPLQTASDAAPCELLWRAGKEAPSRSSDEEALSRLIQPSGLGGEAPAPPPQTAVPPAEPQPAAADGGLIATPLAAEPRAAVPSAAEPSAAEPDTVTLAHVDLEAFAAPPRGKSRWLRGLAAAAAILFIVGAALAVAYKHTWMPKPAAVAALPASSASASPAASTAAPPPGPVAGVPQPGPDSSAGQPAIAPIVAPPAQSLPANPAPPASAATAPKPAKPGKPAPKSRKGQAPAPAPAKTASHAALASPAKQPKAAPAGNCDLDANLLPKMLDQAERNRQQGKYPAALRQFRAVLACDRNNARARSGLDLTELAMQH
ncbi:MAG: hypothetical protein ABR924_00070 [Terracidiphilus sp.]